MGAKIHILLVRPPDHIQGAAPHAIIDLDEVEDGRVPELGQIVEVSAEAATFGAAFRGEIYRRAESIGDDGERLFELVLRPCPSSFDEGCRLRLVWSAPEGH